MAWNPQGGGQGPWGRGPSGGSQPPDLEEILRKGQERFKKLMPGSLGSGTGLALAIAAGVVIWLGSGFYRVEAPEQGVELLFGKFVRTTSSGLNYFFPAPIGTVYTPNVEERNRVDIGFRGAVDAARSSTGADVVEESLILTGDQNIADVDFTVQWRISDAPSFIFNIRDPQGTVKKAAEAAMREVVGQSTLEAALVSGRGQIETRTQALLQGILDSYQAGILITAVQLLKVDPPKPVIDAFNEVQRARQDQERKQNEAEAYRNTVVPTARGEAEQIIQQALAAREKAVRDAEGEAERFIALYQTFEAAKDVTVQRLYLEAMEEVFRGANKVIIDKGGENGGTGVVPYLPLPEIQRRATGAPPSIAPGGTGR